MHHVCSWRKSPSENNGGPRPFSLPLQGGVAATLIRSRSILFGVDEVVSKFHQNWWVFRPPRLRELRMLRGFY
jgi:hypothetical protein